MWLVLAGALVGVAVLLATGIVAYHEGESQAREFPNSIPGSRTDASYQDAFRHHNIQLPVDVSDLEYQAYSNIEGYPMDAEFVMPCTEEAGFVKANQLTEYAGYQDILGGGPDFFIIDRGWIVGSTHNHWYAVPVERTTTLQILVYESTSCHVYLSATDYW